MCLLGDVTRPAHADQSFGSTESVQTGPCLPLRGVGTISLPYAHHQLSPRRLASSARSATVKLRSPRSVHSNLSLAHADDSLGLGVSGTLPCRQCPLARPQQPPPMVRDDTSRGCGAQLALCFIPAQRPDVGAPGDWRAAVLVGLYTAHKSCYDGVCLKEQEGASAASSVGEGGSA